MAISHQLKDAYKQYGLWNLLGFLTGKLLHKTGYVKENYLVFEQSLQSDIQLKKLAEGYFFEEIRLHNLEKCQTSWMPENRISLFKERILSGTSVGVGIFSEQTGELVYYFWADYGRIEMPDYLDKSHTLRLEKEEAYLYDGYCHPDHRGKGFHGFAAQFLMKRAQESGKAKMVTIIRSINRAAILSQQKVGFIATREIRFRGNIPNIKSSIRVL